MNKLFVFIVMVACSTIYAATDESFIVKQSEKKITVSKNKLKEKIASSLKDALDATSNLVGTCGTLLQAGAKYASEKESSHVELVGSMLSEISSLQKRCTLSVERLIDNKRPFKVATRGQLASTNDVLLDAIKKLSVQEKECSRFVHENKSKKNAFTTQVKNHCQAWHSELSLINSRLACNDCLR